MTPRDLDALEVRILGSLLEKQQSTPEYYPLTVNGLQAACNQKSNRDPVMEVTELDVSAALDRLKEQQLVWRILGGRSVRWEHNLDEQWVLDAPAKALITLLLLRGPQTPGELRARSDRLYTFGALDEVEQALRAMASRPEPLVAELTRRPGQKETRWAQLMSGAPEDHPGPPPAAGPVVESLERRVEQLEARVETLSEAVDRLKQKLSE